MSDEEEKLKKAIQDFKKKEGYKNDQSLFYDFDKAVKAGFDFAIELNKEQLAEKDARIAEIRKDFDNCFELNQRQIVKLDEYYEQLKAKDARITALEKELVEKDARISEMTERFEDARNTALQHSKELSKRAERIDSLAKDNERLVKILNTAHALIMVGYPDDGAQQADWIACLDENGINWRSQALAQTTEGEPTDAKGSDGNG